MLKSIYKGGSAIILLNPKDEDYFYYYENNEECTEALINNKNHKVDNHYIPYKNRLNIFYGCYAYPLMQYISGEEISEFKIFNICEHKKEYKEKIQYHLEHWTKNYKGWYHIYIACMMFKNGKNEITEEQKEIAQQIHDNGITDEQLQIIQEILNSIE